MYVKGKRKLVGRDSRSGWAFTGQNLGMGANDNASGTVPRFDYKMYKEAEYKSVLPEDQQALLDMLAEMSRIYKFDLKVIDVTQEGCLRKFWQQRVKGIRTFPTLMSDSGERIQGQITPEQVKAIIKH